LIEDSPDDAEFLFRELRRGGFEVDAVRVETAEAMRAALRDRVWDIVISDHSLPTFSAPEAFAVLRETALDLPFIMVSGTVGEEVAVEAMRTGIHDYLLKGHLRRLVAAVERELREAALRAEKRKTDRQLLISERMASVGTLAAGVAHEINNPLSVVIGNLEFAMEQLARLGPVPAQGALAEQLREPLSDAQEAAERVRLIVRDLRLFSRADEEARGPTDVRKVLDSSLRMARNEIRHRAQVVRDFRDVPLIHGNEARLGQVFLNLLVNAAQAIAEGHADQNKIIVTTRTQDQRVLVEIADTGAGIPPEVLPRIFGVFFTTKAVGVGTGLGLAICHRIVTAMDGEITVVSQVGVGTKFCVSLPASPRAPSRELPIQYLSATSIRRRSSVLIVDDEPAIARMLERILAPHHDAIVATSGLQALALLEQNTRFEVILCDLMMPKMTGMDLHAEIEKRDAALARRIIFMTGGAFTPRACEFLDAIGNPRIDKPVNGDLLRKIIDDLVGSAASARVTP
jgi:signal transduction histidine kinase